MTLLRVENNPLLHAYQAAVTARYCDQIERSLTSSGSNNFQIGSGGAETNCLIQQFISHEDHLFLHWRDRALRLSKGIEVQEIANSYFNLSDLEGCDRNLTGHETKLVHNLAPIASSASSQCLPACGSALSQSKMKKNTGITICSLGDGSTRQGEFFEALAFSLEQCLPIVWVVIDNELAISTRTTGRTVFDLEMFPQNQTLSMEGTNIAAVLAGFQMVTSEARRGSGPWLVRHILPRIGPHTSHDDESIYLSQFEIERNRENDSLKYFRNYLLDAEGVEEGILLELEQNSSHNVQRVYQEAATRVKYHKTLIAPKSPTHNKPKSVKISNMTIGESLRNTLVEIFCSRPETILLGEDVEDPLGGVFRLTKGLSTQFPGRVINSPLAEASLIGVASGLSSFGHLPIVEIQFIDFLSPGWNQLVTNLCTQSWRTNGAWPSPVILYAPAGGYSPGEGMFHSHVNASLLARNDGLIVVYPSTPWDVRDAFLLATEDSDPTFIMLPKVKIWDSKFLAGRYESKGLKNKKAKVVQNGSDLTLVTWGNGVWVSLEASRLIPEISIEVVDMRYLSPLDFETIKESLIRTKRLAIVDEEHPKCSITSDIIRLTTTDKELFELLLAPPLNISRLRQHLCCTEEDELNILPQPENVAASIRRLFDNNS